MLLALAGPALAGRTDATVDDLPWQDHGHREIARATTRCDGWSTSAGATAGSASSAFLPGGRDVDHVLLLHAHRLAADHLGAALDALAAAGWSYRSRPRSPPPSTRCPTRTPAGTGRRGCIASHP
ncbi:MAG: hypothetical protein ACOZNI_18265 [Myxococcota bacterium]